MIDLDQAQVPETKETTKLIVNGASFDGDAATLADLVAQLGYGAQRVATAVNGDFVASSDREAYTLKAGDRIEIVAPRQGG